MTTTTHSPNCTRPSWTTEPSRTLQSTTVARCTQCGAVELRAEPGRGPSQGPSSRTDHKEGRTA